MMLGGKNRARVALLAAFVLGAVVATMLASVLVPRLVALRAFKPSPETPLVSSPFPIPRGAMIGRDGHLQPTPETQPWLHHPAVDSDEARAILGGLRPAIEQDVGQPVFFYVNALSADGVFAYAQVIPRTASGGPIDYSKTKYASALRDGSLDGGPNAPAYALLRNVGASWTVLTFRIGPTDVVYARWWSQFGAPKDIFPYTE
jgi:hypothetical protein